MGPTNPDWDWKLDTWMQRRRCFWTPDTVCYTFMSSSLISQKEVDETIWLFPKIGVPQNGWFIMENPI